MSIHNRSRFARREHGLSLVELVIFIVVVSIAVAGVLLVLNQTTRNSANPQVRKQALAIAEALLEEVELMPFTACDPDGYDAATGNCTQTEGMGPETTQGEARGSASAPFDNVNDYNSFSLSGGGTDLGNSPSVTVPAGYSASVAVTQDGALGPAGAQPVAAAVLRIAVTVQYNGGSVVLEGYRTKYAPNAMP